MTSNHVKTAVEFLYLQLMLRWENTAPANKHSGHLDGKKTPNSQTARLAFILNKIASGDEERTFQAVARFSRRNDGESYVSKNSIWMEKPYPLLKGWFLEGGQSLPQKQNFSARLFTACWRVLFFRRSWECGVQEPTVSI